jgi:hypothetical protein
MAKKKAVRERWSVCIDRLHKVVVAEDGKLAYSHDRQEAEKIARGVGGRVVDTAAWAKRPRFLNQAELYQIYGGTAIELGLSRSGSDPIKEVRITKISFKSGLGRRGKRLRPATINLVIEYDT